ncbi:MAG: hypothetical protein LQ338_006523 [Usnochroma carphineum]|nr:MAG: hypothetical protein LQ338_006523 [Usnochroma carphineum]
MAEQENMKRIVVPYLTHPGSRYGLPYSVQYPSDCIEVLRCRPFTFSARSCNKWALKRVILCGDSAHVFPPFGGQGIASGFRDALALAWRLAVACRSFSSSHSTPASTDSPHHTRLLTGWYVERKQQLDKSLAATVENGAYVCEANRLKILVRDWYLWALQLVPSWKHWLEMGQRRDGMTRYTYEEGVAFLPSYGGGFCFPQVYCVGLGEQQATKKPEVYFTDDVIFASHKRALFQVVVLCSSVADASAAHTSLRSLDADSDGELSAAETTYIIHDLRADAASSSNQPPSTSLFRIASADEFASSPLCVARPEPLFYDPYRLWKEADGKPFLVLRPDRFVFAACKDAAEVGTAARELVRLLNGTV